MSRNSTLPGIEVPARQLSRQAAAHSSRSTGVERFLKAKPSELNVFLYDVIDTWSFDATAFGVALDEAKDVERIVVRINSPGGNAFMGATIYNLLREHDAEVVVKIDGLAASAASLVAMAGDKILIGDAAEIMIHNPYAFASGDWRRMEQIAADLRKFAARYADVYAMRSGQTTKACAEFMDKTTFFGAEEAIKLGFATGKLIEEESDEDAKALFKAPDRRPLDVVYRDRLAAAGASEAIRVRQEDFRRRAALRAQKISLAEKSGGAAVKGAAARIVSP